MKKTPMSAAEIGVPTTPCDSRQLDLDPFGKRPIDPLAHRPQCGQRRGVLALGRAADGPFGDAEGKIQLIVAEAQRLFFLAPQLVPLARFVRVVDQAATFVD